MELSRRMKEILVVLARARDGITRYGLLYIIEKDNWLKKTRKGKRHNRIPLNSVRVSYDRTLSQLVNLNLVYGFYYDDLPNLPPHYQNRWLGRTFKLTDRGKKVANEIIVNVLKESERLNQLILNGLDDP